MGYPLLMQNVKVSLGRALDALFPKAWLQFNISRHDRHMEPEFWLVPFFCDRSSIALDIGANAGIFTFYMRQFSRLVIAFEPNLECLNKLKARAVDNVVVLFGGASDRIGIAELRYDPTNTGIGTLDPRNTLQQFQHVQTTTFHVPTFPVDALALKGVSFIKIDVEGHESAVLRGALQTLSRERPALLVESENRHVAGAVEDVCSCLVEIGYSGYVLDGKTLVQVASVAGNRLSDPIVSNKNNFIFLHDDRRDEYKARLTSQYNIA